MRARRWNGWGFEGEAYAVPARARDWIEDRVGAGEPLAAVSESALDLPEPRAIPPVGAATASDGSTRLRASCGQSFSDLVALRTGTLAAVPDAVAFPAGANEVIAALRAAETCGARVIPRGGGTSVTGGVTIAPGERPCLVLSLDRLAGLTALDRTSLLATFGAGTYGPDVEAALAPHGLRLGHEPQSFALSTIGGWTATRSAGQRSTGVGKIEDLVAGLEVATARGVWRLAPQPASAAGPDLCRLIVGSEGRLGVITSVTVRVRPLPRVEEGTFVLMPSWEAGAAACRELLQRDVPVEVMRLSDPDESAFALSLLHVPALFDRPLQALARTRRVREGCLLLLAWTGSGGEVKLARLASAEVWRARDGIALGGRGFRQWRRDRFRHPYLRDALLDLGWGVDTLETAAPWSKLGSVYAAVREAIAAAGARSVSRVTTLCHLSHGYRDGASLYFTFFWALVPGREVEQWRRFKEAATEALLAAGGTLSHHHGVGTMHAPYLTREIGARGVEVLRAAALTLDPGATLNPGVLLAAAERGTGLEPRAAEPDSGGG